MSYYIADNILAEHTKSVGETKN